MREFTDGSRAIVRGAIDAGCRFFAGYPITPASPILMGMLERLPAVGGVAVQAEDEIASIGMCIGAAMSGMPAMTATSGPGISLKSENIGLAIMGEVPLVIVDVQRLGPATGGATTCGQGDVQFVRWGTSGGYPIIALAPSTIGECHELTVKAFDFARKYRCPVFLLTDKELNLTQNTVPVSAFDTRPMPFEEPRESELPATPYRFDPPEDVPPLVPLGSERLVRFTGSTHDEAAIITKDPKVVERLNRHLVDKIERHVEDMTIVTPDLETGARTLFVSYGITASAMREAVRCARRSGKAVSALTLKTLWPRPDAAIRAALDGIERVVVGELNLGQYRREIEHVAQGREVLGIHRVDGELITPAQFLEVLP